MKRVFYFCLYCFKWWTGSGIVAMVYPFTREVLVIPECAVLPIKMVRHEGAHIKQVERLGACCFLFKYLWYSLRYGYRDNPFEVEARQAEG